MKKNKIFMIIITVSILLIAQQVIFGNKILQTPYVHISSHPDFSSSDEKIIHIFGFCTDEIGIKEIGYEMQYPDGGMVSEFWTLEETVYEYDFMITVELVEGSDGNTINVYAKNIEDVKGYDTINVVYIDNGPKPFFVKPDNEELIGGEVLLWAGCNTHHKITLTQFYYSKNQQNWILIGEDTDGTEISEANPIDCNSSIGYGWSYIWDTSDLDDGIYYLRAQMWTNMEQTGYTDIQVTVDPTPPTPIFTDLEYDQTVHGTIPLTVFSYDENIDNTIYYGLRGGGTFERTIELKNQHHYMDGHGPYYRGHPVGDHACAPTAAAACLRFWSDLFLSPYRDIMREPTSGRTITQSHLVEELGVNASTDEDGTSPSNLTESIRRYLSRRHLDDRLEVHIFTGSTLANDTTGEMNHGESNFSRYKEELEMDREDVIWGYQWFERNSSTNRYDRAGGHSMTGVGVNNIPANDEQGRYHNVTFMDPWTGTDITVRMRDNGSFIKDGHWCHPGPMITVSVIPQEQLTDNNDLIELGVDDNPDDGWSINWDTTDYEDGVWFIRAIMTDKDGNQGEKTIVVHVDNTNINNPPNLPSIDGPGTGKPKTEYPYTISTTDPDGDDVYYCIDWGDETDEVCIGPYLSGEEITVNHTWSTKGTYTVKVKARDVNNAESDWATLEVTVPKSQPYINTLIIKLSENHPILYQILQRLLNL